MDDYQPAVRTATEKEPVHLTLHDPRLEDPEHVQMPDEDEASHVLISDD